MTHIRSRFAHTLGGVVLAVGLVAGVGCTGSRSWRVQDVMPWVPTEPATQIVSAFNPQVQHLPDPSKDGQMGAGLSGQLYMIAGGGKFTDANGDLYVMADDITARPPGQPPAVTEIWHFDPVTLRKLRTKDERFGDCYALFLPYPPSWKDVTHIRISTQYKPKGDPAKEPTLSSPPQTVTLDFTPPGEQPSVWLDKSGPKPTAPVAMKAMPNVSRDIARGLGAPHTGPQPNGTVNAGGPPPTSPVMPAGGPPQFAPPGGVAAPPPTTPLLPPPMTFTPDRPEATTRGPNGETMKVTAMALPPGQNVPPGWTRQPDGSIQPPAVVTNQQYQSQPQQTWPAQNGQTTQVSYQPPPNYVPASQQHVPASQQPQFQSRIQHGAFNQNQPLPPLPHTAVPPARTALPPVNTVPGNVPAMPTTPSGVSGPVMPVNLPPQQPNFDPNSPVGGWATQPPPVAPVPPPPPGGGYAPPVAPPPAAGYDAPLIPAVIKPSDRR